MNNVFVTSFKKKYLNEFIDLSQTEYSSLSTANPCHIQWKHLESPHGPSTYIRIIENGKTIGRSLLQPRLIRTQMGEYSAGCVTDVLIDSQHRSSPSNFINLTNASANIAKFSSIYHTSNEVTEPFYRKLFRLPNPFSLSGYGFPTRISGLFLKVFGYRINVLDWLITPFHWLISFLVTIFMVITKINFSERMPNDEMLSVLSSKLLLNSGSFFSRNESFLKWRLEDAPLWKAKVFCLERERCFLGYVATRSLELNGLSYLVVIDFFIDTDLTFLQRLTLRLWLMRQTIKSGNDAIFTMVNPSSNASGVCVGFPFIRIPDKYLPHRTPIFFRANDIESQFVESERKMHMTLADIDYF